jgi:transposase
MIALPHRVRVLIATKPIDFRKCMDGLAAVVKEHLRADPFSGTIFVFRAKPADRVKLWSVPACQATGAGRLPLAADHRRHVAPDAFTACGLE